MKEILATRNCIRNLIADQYHKCLTLQQIIELTDRVLSKLPTVVQNHDVDACTMTNCEACDVVELGREDVLPETHFSVDDAMKLAETHVKYMKQIT